MLSLCPSRRLPASRGPGAAVTGITSPRPKSNCSNGVFTSHTFRSTPQQTVIKEWDAWYAYLTGQYGLSKKPAFIGMSRGGEFEYRWGTANPDKVSCIYADNPGMDREGFQRLGDLARADVPVLQVCGTIDPIFGRMLPPSRPSIRSSADASR